jgi:7,8-dihydroneopterin aldolase/epimerase/oxygenase
VNYAEIAAQARQITEKARRFTVEALATDLAKQCLSDPRVHSVRVRVEKPAILPGCRSVGVEIERSQPD